MDFYAGSNDGSVLGWYGEEQDTTVFGGYGPSGVATIVAELEAGLTLTLSWHTPINPHFDGTEQRISTLDRPNRRYDGVAKLVDALPRKIRAQLARFAAGGQPFLLGLPYEALPLTVDAFGTIVSVPAAWIPKSDWMHEGQRVLVRKGPATVDAVIQDATGGAITLDIAPGAAGAQGGEIMPAMAVLLDTQQDFDRAKTAVETWKLKARSAIFDFAPASPFLDLAAFTGDATMAGAILTSRLPGVFGEILINFSNSGVAELAEGGLATTVYFRHGITTLADVETMLEGSSNLKLTGAYNPAAVLTLSEEFTTSLVGTQASGDMGNGAALTTYDGHPVWDRRLLNAGSVTEAVHSDAETLDLGGVPYSLGFATYPSWGRTVAIKSDDPDQWQWLKLFLATARGAQCMFWLPTWRDDFTWVSTGASSGGSTPLVIRDDDDSDIAAWYPQQRDRLMIRQLDGSITYAQITGTPVDHGDGTMTITVNAVIGVLGIDLISWLEPCRFESDDFAIKWASGRTFEMSTMARAFAVSDPSIAELG